MTTSIKTIKSSDGTAWATQRIGRTGQWNLYTTSGDKACGILCTNDEENVRRMVECLAVRMSGEVR